MAPDDNDLWRKPAEKEPPHVGNEPLQANDGFFQAEKIVTPVDRPPSTVPQPRTPLSASNRSGSSEKREKARAKSSSWFFFKKKQPEPLNRNTIPWTKRNIRKVRQATDEHEARVRRSVARNIGDIFIFILVIFALTAFTYFRALPRRYVVKVGDVSTIDITSKRALIDHTATQDRAEAAAASVQTIYKRSDAVSSRSLKRLDTFFSAVTAIRTQLKEETSKFLTPASNASTPNESEAKPRTEPSGGTAGTEPATPATANPSAPAATGSGGAIAPTPYYTAEQIDAAAKALQKKVSADMGVQLSDSNAKVLVSLENTFYLSYTQQAHAVAEKIMSDKMDRQGLDTEIDQQVKTLTDSVSFYKTEYASIAPILKLFLEPNVETDATATAQARAAARARINDDPSMIPAGTRIVNVGQTITDVIYQQLKELNLVYQPGIEFNILLPIAAVMFLLGFLTLYYLRGRQDKRLKESKDRWLLLICLIVVYIVSAYLSSFSVYALPIVTLAIVVTLHYGFESGLVVSLICTLAMLPLLTSEAGVIFPLVFSLLVVAYVSAEQARLKNTAVLIVSAAVTPILAVLVYGASLKVNWGANFHNALIAGIAGGMSAIVAIGVEPLLELMTSSVSASQLIRMAQPSQALLRRLFLEAPGTYQHSMMVANLAEKAAEVVGADSLLARVGAYYHDIGKMAHPEVFTENQSDYNPHDYLKARESVALIIGHVEMGVKTARRYRIPERLQDFIREHHGNTLQASFYAKACEQAAERGEPNPDETDFCYPWPIPRSRETAIVMLADSLEAAMRSTQTKTIEGVEALARKIVKIKNEQNQLVDSGLSYQEVESIIQSFVKVYSGMFHERVRYPDEIPVSQQTK